MKTSKEIAEQLAALKCSYIQRAVEMAEQKNCGNYNCYIGGTIGGGLYSDPCAELSTRIARLETALKYALGLEADKATEHAEL